MINAIRLTEELEKAGFTPEQAKKSVDTWMSLINDNFATKSDFREFQLVNKSDLRELQVTQENQIKQIRTDLEGQIKDLRTDLEGQIKDLRSDLNQMSSRIVIQLGAVIVATATIATTIISLVIMR
jgi:ElaB/YqjD/DUF883 family membrane-anchored ribosome-binding protein